jgi:hypothetical protein
MTEEVKPKPWWLSRGVIGPLISVAAMGAQAAGVDADVSGLLSGALEFITVAGIALGWWGRVEATAPIDKHKVFPGFSF